MPFAQGIAAPIANRNDWVVHSYSNISRINQVLEHKWPKHLNSPTHERLPAAMLADDSFTFDGEERRRCRNGISKPHLHHLLQMYHRLKVSVGGRR
jgi:hypothetical protein